MAAARRWRSPDALRTHRPARRLGVLGLLRLGYLGRCLLEFGDHLAQDLDEAPALRGIAPAPAFASRALVRQLELRPRELGRVGIGVELRHDLIGEDVPM